MTGNLRSVAHDNLTVTVVHLASSCFILLSSRFVSFEVLLRVAGKSDGAAQAL